MTIAKRLMILLAVPLVALLGIGIFSRFLLSKVETRSRFMAEIQVPSLGVLGNLSRNFTELRVEVRTFLLATNEVEQAKCRSAFDASELEVTRMLQRYADQLISDDQDRRFLEEYRSAAGEWVAGARQVMKLAAEGRRDDAVSLLNGAMADLSAKIGSASSEWIQHNQNLAAAAGAASIQAITES